MLKYFISISNSYVFFLEHNFLFLSAGTMRPAATFQYRMWNFKLTLQVDANIVYLVLNTQN